MKRAIGLSIERVNPVVECNGVDTVHADVNRLIITTVISLEYRCGFIVVGLLPTNSFFTRRLRDNSTQDDIVAQNR